MKATLPSLQPVCAVDDSKYSSAAQSFQFCYSATERQSNNTDSPRWGLPVSSNTSDTNISV